MFHGKAASRIKSKPIDFLLMSLCCMISAIHRSSVELASNLVFHSSWDTRSWTWKYPSELMPLSCPPWGWVSRSSEEHSWLWITASSLLSLLSQKKSSLIFAAFYIVKEGKVWWCHGYAAMHGWQCDLPQRYQYLLKGQDLGDVLQENNYHSLVGHLWWHLSELLQDKCFMSEGRNNAAFTENI